MGKVTISMRDYDNEATSVGFPVADLTAANIDAQFTAAIALQSAVEGITLGKVQSRSHMAKTSPQGVGAATSELAQREDKALVSYYDSVTYERATVEVPCIDLLVQLTGHPGVFYLESQAGNEEAAVTAFVTAFEAMVIGPGGNAAVIERIIHVGRNI